MRWVQLIRGWSQQAWDGWHLAALVDGHLALMNWVNSCNSCGHADSTVNTDVIIIVHIEALSRRSMSAVCFCRNFTCLFSRLCQFARYQVELFN